MANLEYERLGRIRASGKTHANIQKETAADLSLRGKSTYLEAPIPYYQGCCDPFEKKGIKGVATETADYWHNKVLPEMDKKVLVELISESTRLAYIPNRFENIGRGKIAYEQKAERQTFLKKLLQNSEYRRIWIAGQKIALLKMKFESPLNVVELGLSSQFLFSDGRRRGGTFLVSPERTDLFTINADQGHHDFMFEILAMKDIPEKQILGYIEFDGEGSERLLEEAIAKNARFIYDESFKFIEWIKKSITTYDFAAIKRLKRDLKWSKEESIKESLARELQEKVKKVCAILDIDERSFLPEEAWDKIETTPGIITRYIKYNKLSPEHLRDFPIIPTKELTLQQARQQIYEQILPRLKTLFPFQQFSCETMEHDVQEGLMKYIVDRFGVDPKRMTLKDFIHLVVKTMGIPIYNLKGDQIWPEKKSYKEIHGQAKG